MGQEQREQSFLEGLGAGFGYSIDWWKDRGFGLVLERF